MVDIYSHGRQLEQAITKLKTREDVCPENRQFLLNFLDVLSTRKLSLSRKLKYAHNLTRVAILLGKPFNEASKEDLASLFVKVAKEGYAPNTERDFKILLKKFYQWQQGLPKKQIPEIVAWLETGGGAECKQYDREDLLTPTDYAELLAAADNTRDKLLVALLFHLGARVGEIMALQVGDFFQEQNGTIWGVHIRGTKNKTSIRDVPIRDENTIQLYLGQCATLPTQQKDALLFVARSGRPLSHGSVGMMLRRLFAKAKVAKDCNPHFFRHTRATIWANDPTITRSQLCYLMGWSQSSRMPDVYLHTGRRDVFNVFEKQKAAEQISEERLLDLEARVFSIMLEDEDARKAMYKSAMRNREHPVVKEFFRTVALIPNLHFFNLKADAPNGTANSGVKSADSKLLAQAVKELGKEATKKKAKSSD